MVKGGNNKAAAKKVKICGREVSSIEEYVEICHNSGMNAVPFDKPEYFRELYEKGIIQPEYSYIRTKNGDFDFSYGLLHGGWLEGVQMQEHSGLPGTHKYTDVLSKKKASGGWEVEDVVPPKYRKKQTLDAALKE